MNDQNAFLLITSDPDADTGYSRGAQNLLIARLRSLRWPLFRRTPNRRRIAPGDLLAFYLAGAGPLAGKVVATATVGSVVDWKPAHGLVDPEDFLTEVPASTLELSEVEVLSSPVQLKSVLHQLSIAPSNPTKWGAILQGGCRRISVADWHIIRSGGTGV